MISVPLEPTTHDLKTWLSAFAAVRAGLKAWELRLDDRGYEVGDNLILREWDNHAETYTGEIERRTVTWLLRGPAFGLPQGYVIMSLAAAPSPAGGRDDRLLWAIKQMRECLSRLHLTGDNDQSRNLAVQIADAALSASPAGGGVEALRIATVLHKTVEGLIYGLPKYLDARGLTDEESLIREAFITLDVTAHQLAALSHPVSGGGEGHGALPAAAQPSVPTERASALALALEELAVSGEVVRRMLHKDKERQGPAFREVGIPFVSAIERANAALRSWDAFRTGGA